MTNNTTKTVAEMKVVVGKYSELMAIDVTTVAGLAEVKWDSKVKKADVLAVLTKMEAIYKKRKGLIDAIVRYEGGEADITMTSKELRNRLTELQTKEEEEQAMTTNQQPTQEETTITTEQLPEMIDYKGADYVHVDYTKTLIEQAIIRTQQNERAIAEEAMRKIQDNIPTMEEAAIVEAPKTEPAKEEEQEVTPAQRNALIVKLNEELERLQKLKDRYVVFDTKKFYQVVDQYRAVEERLLTLKGGDVKNLISEKYNGLTRTAAKGLYNAADVTEKYGHKGVDRGAELLNSIFDSVVGVTKDVVGIAEKTGKATINVAGQLGHAGVDLTAGTMRAGGDLINNNKK